MPVNLPDFKTVQIFEHHVTESPETYKAFRNTPDGSGPSGTFWAPVTAITLPPCSMMRSASHPAPNNEVDPWVERVNSKLEKHLDDISLVEEDYQQGAKIAILSYGASAHTARHALKLACPGKKVDMLTLLTIWLPKNKWRHSGTAWTGSLFPNEPGAAGI